MLCFQEEIRQLAALVRTDELTRMFNFRYFNQALSLEVERTRRSGQPTCLIMLGLDHFKAVNDAYGHEAGNVVLGHIFGLVKKTVRRLDIPCRCGGEELTEKKYVEKVDSFLYLAKKEGRNKVCHSTFSDEGKSGSVSKELNSERPSFSARLSP